MGSKISLVGLYINVYLAFLKDKMEIILGKKNDFALHIKHRKMLYVILKGSKEERTKGEEKDGTVDRYTVPVLK